MVLYIAAKDKLRDDGNIATHSKKKQLKVTVKEGTVKGATENRIVLWKK